MIDRLGKCPNCGRKWDDGDVLHNLNKMSVFMHTTSGAMNKIAASLGYTPEKPNSFSAVIVHQLGDIILYECPKVSCKHVFNAKTGEEYSSLFEFKRKSTKEEVKDGGE